MVSTSDLAVTQGRVLHQLTARALIRDWIEGSLAEDRTQHEVRLMCVCVCVCVCVCLRVHVMLQLCAVNDTEGQVLWRTLFCESASRMYSIIWQDRVGCYGNQVSMAKCRRPL